jgi:FMN-dependent NADH-azoreductase
VGSLVSFRRFALSDAILFRPLINSFSNPISLMNTPSLLLINASPRGNERSASRKLAAEYLAAWQTAHPDGRVTTRDLGQQPPPAITEAWIVGTHTPPDQHSAEARDAVAASDGLIDELLATEEIVIATPIHNFSMPGVLKLWIDQVVRFGRTFTVGTAGPSGLAVGRRLKVLVASGADLRLTQPFGAMNFLEPYLRGIFGFIGITQVEFIYAHSQSAKGREAVFNEAVAATRASAAA